MARIRTFKPEFLRHEELQELENKHHADCPMFVFLGLWSVCDKQGVFQWKPKSLKLDIYPFLDYDMETTLNILLENGFIQKFEADDGDTYGFVINFEKHQRINGDEAKNPAKYPPPPDEATKKHVRSSQEASEDNSRSSQENGKGKGVKEREIGMDSTAIGNVGNNNKPIALLNREPKNNLERVNKKWLENYIHLHGSPPINPRWDISSPLVSSVIKQAGIDKALQALDTAKQDEFCLKSGYILQIIMGGNVISRLINKPSTGPPQKHRIAADYVPPEKVASYFTEAG